MSHQQKRRHQASGGEDSRRFSVAEICLPPHLSRVAQSTVRFSERRLLRQALSPATPDVAGRIAQSRRFVQGHNAATYATELQ